jgi:hypothetical protein
LEVAEGGFRAALPFVAAHSSGRLSRGSPRGTTGLSESRAAHCPMSLAGRKRLHRRRSPKLSWRLVSSLAVFVQVCGPAPSLRKRLFYPVGQIGPCVWLTQERFQWFGELQPFLRNPRW